MIKFVIGERFLSSRRGIHPPLMMVSDRGRAIATGLAIVADYVGGRSGNRTRKRAGNVQRLVDLERIALMQLSTVCYLPPAATLIVFLATFLGYWRARARTRLRGVFDLVLLVIFAVPSTVLGVGLITCGIDRASSPRSYKSGHHCHCVYCAFSVTVATLILANERATDSRIFLERGRRSGWWKLASCSLPRLLCQT